jgi:hypothetical protein
VQHKTVWTVGGIAAKNGAGGMVFSPTIALSVGDGRTARVRLGLFFFGIVNVDANVYAQLAPRADQSELLPLNFEGTKFTVEASCRSGKVSKRIGGLRAINPDGLSRHPSALQLTEQGDFIAGGETFRVKLQELVGDKIVVTADWMIERKATHISTA